MEIEQIKKNQKQEIMSASLSYEGPIPPASEMKKYEEVNPGFANRIMMMAENQVYHRHEIEKKDLEARIACVEREDRMYKRGQNFGFAIVIISLLLAFVLAILNRPVAGVIVGILGPGSIVTAFLYGKFKR